MMKILNKILLFFSGAFVLYSTAWLFDYVLYPFVIYKAGLVYGFFIMLLLSFLSCLILLLLYNYLKKDIFGFEFAKHKIDGFIDTNHGNYVKRMLRGFLKRSKVLLYIVLSVYDPFIAAVFMRKGDFQSRVISRRDWRNLTLSVIVGNGVWAPMVFAGVSFVEFIYGLIAG